VEEAARPVLVKLVAVKPDAMRLGEDGVKPLVVLP
jgi:hypothetical protein